MHGSAGKLPPNAISPARAEQVTAFIRNYASVHGLPQPAFCAYVFNTGVQKVINISARKLCGL